MNSATLFDEAPVIKAQRDRQGNNNLYTSERLNKRVVLICCPCNGGVLGFFLSFFLFGGGGGVLASYSRRQLEQVRIFLSLERICKCKKMEFMIQNCSALRQNNN